jgi:protein-disulfide isomerase
MSKTVASIALVCALVGLGVSTAAAYVHYRQIADPGYVSFCDINASVSCTEVYASQYGTFAGVSVAVYGVIWFAFATLLTLAALLGPPTVRESAPAYLFAASTIGLAVVLYLGYASLVILGLVCILCVVTYASVIALFLISGAATAVPMMSVPQRAVQDLKAVRHSPLAMALAALFVIGTASALAFFPRETPAAVAGGNASPEPGGAAPATDQARMAEFVRFYEAQPRVTLNVPADGAKVLIVKFNDYQCPACGESFRAYKSVLAKYEASHPGAVRLVTRDFPLETECNTGGPHQAACEAAVAVRLARPKGRAEALEEYLFANQKGMTADNVKQAAREVGQVTDFDARYQATLEQVKADSAYGRQLGVGSTPTFFINGVKLDGMLPAVYFDQAISYELERAK